MSDHETRVQRLMERKEPEVLTPIMQRYVEEYLIDLNQTAAAIRAGYEPSKAARISSRMMRKGHVVAIAVARAMAARSARTGFTQDRILREVAKVAFGDPRNIFNEDGSLKKPTEYDADDAAMLVGVKTRRIVEKDPTSNELVQVELQEVKIESKLRALELLGKHMGLFTEKIDINVMHALSTRMDAAFARTGRKPGAALIEGEAEEVHEEDDVDPLADLPPETQEIGRRLLQIHQAQEAVQTMLFGQAEPVAEQVFDINAALKI